MNPTTSSAGADPGATGRGSLWAGGLAALLASTCCIAPLLLLSLGVSGAWISNLTALEPYQPIFIVIALAAMALAWRKIWRPATCAADAACAKPGVSRIYKLAFAAVAALITAVLLFPLAAPWFY